MEGTRPGLRARFRDWRHRRSPSPSPNYDVLRDNGTDELSTLTTTTQLHSSPGVESSNERGIERESDNPNAAASNIQLSTVAPEFTSPGTERLMLWQEAYDKLRKEHPDLIEHYEAAVKDDAGLPQNIDLQEQMGKVVKAQRAKTSNKQWRFQWFGQQQSVRDTVEGILNLTDRSASLISIGMAYSPPYISIPWSTVTALIPLMMNEFKEHKACISGLETVTKLTFSYQMAEGRVLRFSRDVTSLQKIVDGSLRKDLGILRSFSRVLHQVESAATGEERSWLHSMGRHASLPLIFR